VLLHAKVLLHGPQVSQGVINHRLGIQQIRSGVHPLKECLDGMCFPFKIDEALCFELGAVYIHRYQSDPSFAMDQLSHTNPFRTLPGPFYSTKYFDSWVYARISSCRLQLLTPSSAILRQPVTLPGLYA